MPEETFGARLRRERERRQIALSSISENTKISASLFERLERNDVSRWPSGIFRRAFIRSYAQAIGLDPDAIAKEFLERFPDPAEVAPVEPVEAAAAAKTSKPLPAPAPRPVAPPPQAKKPALQARQAPDARQALVTVTVRVPKWMSERVFTVVRPWSRA